MCSAIVNLYRDIPLAIYQFNDFTFDSVSGELSKKEHQQRLEPNIARLLCFFLDNNHQLLSRDKIIEQVWQGRFVSDDTINRGISILRQALNPQDKAAFIKTVPKRGYQASFILKPDHSPNTKEMPENTPEPASTKPTSGDNRLYTNTGKRSTISKHALWVALFLIAGVVLFRFTETTPLRAAVSTPNTIAVLPFLDVSDNEQSTYLGEGISDTIISTLSARDNLQIIARTSSFSLDQQQYSIAEIADILGANYILEGSTQLDGEKLKVNARLIDADTQSAVWASSFSRSLSDLLSVQDDIAHSVLIAISGSVLGSVQSRYQPSFEAYNEMILGRHALNLQSHQGILQAKAYFEKAIELDNGYALAYIMLANSLLELNRINPQTQEYNARRYNRDDINGLIERALTLDPLLSEAHSLKGKLYLQTQQHELARLSLDKALMINPNNASALADLAQLNIYQNEINQAVITARRALLLNPQDSQLHQLLASSLWHNGRAEEAIAVIKDNITINPNAANNYSLLSRWTLQLGNAFDAMKYAVQEWRLDPANPSRHWAVCLMHIQVWDEQKAEACIAALLDRYPDYYEAKQYRYLLRNDRDGALALIREQVNTYPNAVYYKLQLANLLVINQQWQEGIAILASMYPNLMSPKPAITAGNIWAATSLGDALMSTGQTEQAKLILNASLDFVDKSRKLQDGGFTSGIDDVFALALLGNMKQALDRLESAIDNGWLFYSYMYFKMPDESLAQSARFQQLKLVLKSKAEKFQQQIAEQLGNDLGFETKKG